MAAFAKLPRAHVAFAGLGVCQDADIKVMEIKVKSLQKQLTKALESKSTAIAQAQCWQGLCMKERVKNKKLEQENLILTTEHEKLGKWLGSGGRKMEERWFEHKFKVAKKPSLLCSCSLAYVCVHHQ